MGGCTGKGGLYRVTLNEAGWELLGEEPDTLPAWVSQRLLNHAQADPARRRLEGAEAESVAMVWLAARLGSLPLTAELSRLTCQQWTRGGAGRVGDRGDALVVAHMLRHGWLIPPEHAYAPG